MKLMPPYDQIVPVPRPAVLPPKARGAPPVTLVLDLDETLVHCSVEEVPNPDLVFPVRGSAWKRRPPASSAPSPPPCFQVEFNGVVYQVFVRKRPGMDAFLRRVSRSFEVIVFTASQQVYAEKLLDKLDPKGTLIQCGASGWKGGGGGRRAVALWRHSCCGPYAAALRAPCAATACTAMRAWSLRATS